MLPIFIAAAEPVKKLLLFVLESVILQPLIKASFQREITIVHCPDGGTGRRARLKIWYWQQCAGSIPVPGTMIIN